MEDIFAKYKRKRRIKRVWIVVASLMVALSINFVVNDSSMWTALKTNIKEIQKTQTEAKVADVYLQEVSWSVNPLLTVNNSKDISNAKSLWFSLAYNAEIVSIIDISSDIIWAEVKEVSSENGLVSVTLSFSDGQNISSNTEIATILLNKKWNNLENMNLVNANFKDASNEIYELSTKWEDF